MTKGTVVSKTYSIWILNGIYNFKDEASYKTFDHILYFHKFLSHVDIYIDLGSDSNHKGWIGKMYWKPFSEFGIL